MIKNVYSNRTYKKIISCMTLIFSFDKIIMNNLNAILWYIGRQYLFRINGSSTYEKPFSLITTRKVIFEYFCNVFLFAVTITTKDSGMCHCFSYICFQDNMTKKRHSHKTHLSTCSMQLYFNKGYFPIVVIFHYKVAPLRT